MPISPTLEDHSTGTHEQKHQNSVHLPQSDTYTAS
jgi:hypothetical protein